MPFFMKQAKKLEVKINDFLNIVVEAAYIFKSGLKAYLASKDEDFVDKMKRVIDLEAKADDLRRTVEAELYIQTLIPESRGDVLAILENTDDVIDKIKETLLQFSVECPDIPEALDEDFLELTGSCVDCVESLISAVRAFFVDIKGVNNHIHKVHFFETEADRAAEKLKRKIFKMDIELAHKIHLSNFTLHVESISDYAEDVSDRLSIYAIKRQL